MKTKHLLIGVLLVGTVACSNKSKDQNINQAKTQRSLNQSFYFDFNSHKIFKSGQIKEVKDYRKSKIYIEGNCDVRGSDSYNDKLGKRRADYIKNILINEGLSKENVSVISNGKKKLTCSEINEKCHSLNRRVDLFVE